MKISLNIVVFIDTPNILSLKKVNFFKSYKTSTAMIQFSMIFNSFFLISCSTLVSNFTSKQWFWTSYNRRPPLESTGKEIFFLLTDSFQHEQYDSKILINKNYVRNAKIAFVKVAKFNMAIPNPISSRLITKYMYFTYFLNLFVISFIYYHDSISASACWKLSKWNIFANQRVNRTSWPQICSHTFSQNFLCSLCQSSSK